MAHFIAPVSTAIAAQTSAKLLKANYHAPSPSNLETPSGFNVDEDISDGSIPSEIHGKLFGHCMLHTLQKQVEV